MLYTYLSYTVFLIIFRIEPALPSTLLCSTLTLPFVLKLRTFVSRLQLASSLLQLQYCTKVTQTNFDEIPAFRGFSKKFPLKRYFLEISPHFRDTYCFDLRDFSNANSLCLMIYREFSSDNSLLPKSRCDFANNNALLSKIRSIVYQ